MRRLSLLFAVLFVVPLFGYDSPKEYDGSMAAGIEGKWRLTEYGVNGVKEQPHWEVMLTFRSGTWTLDVRGDDPDPDRGTYRIDSTRNPPQLDRFWASGPCKGETYMYIYQSDGDTLRLAFTYSPIKQRPQKFNGKGIVLQTYKRMK